ncbi:hypothetical protein IAU60_005635 [Kwoniella sp. DSM 27419]
MTDGGSPIGLFVQPACLQHKYIRHANASHIFERPERLRAVLLGVAAAVARLEEDDSVGTGAARLEDEPHTPPSTSTGDDLSGLLSSLSIGSSGSLSGIASSSGSSSRHLHIVPPPLAPTTPGSILLHHPAVQLAHSPVPEAPFPYIGVGSSSSGASFPTSSYLRDLFKWANEAVENIKETGCEIPSGLGLNQGDLYLGPGSILAIEGAIQTVCQAVDLVTRSGSPAPSRIIKPEPSTPPVHTASRASFPSLDTASSAGNIANTDSHFTKAFCAIRPPGHHCGENEPSGFCYVNNVVVGAMHGYLQHDIDRAIIIDFDLHHGNGTQALVMPLNAASHAEDLMLKAGKPMMMKGRDGRGRRGWKGFYGSVHDIYSYPCEDGDIDLVKDASISLAAHGQYIENIHLQPYESEEDFYLRIYPLYLALLDKAKVFMRETAAEPSRTIVLISAGFDACEHEHQGMQRHDRRVPTSFFSRYTRDIVAFADQYTEGKVVSVLEGGYSDRALTSAAMGHIVGMTGRLPSSCDAWWREQELVNIEKATKKRRTGKLAPVPSDLTSHSYLHRTHALLGMFEGTPTAESAPPSVASTPQTATRMTLRDRRKVEDPAAGIGSADATPPARRAARGRTTGGSTNATPTRVRVAGGTAARTPTQSKLAGTSETPMSKGAEVAPDEVSSVDAAGSSGGPVARMREEMAEAAARLSAVTLASEDPAIPVGPPAEQARQGDPSHPTALASSGFASTAPVMQVDPSSLPKFGQPSLPAVPAGQSSVPKIILRIPRPQPLNTPESSLAGGERHGSAVRSSGDSSIYPSLPGPAVNAQVKPEDRMVYREGSTSASSEGGTGSEYVDAQSGGEGGA